MIDYLIIGQGLAGTTVAHKLEEYGLSFHIMDNIGHSSSTKVAAGLINPITGRRYVKSWNVDTLIPYAKEFYQSIENKLESSFYKEIAIRKVLANDEIIQFFDKKMSEKEMQDYFLETPKPLPSGLKVEHKNIGSVKGAQLNTSTYLSKSLNYFQNKGVFIEASLDFNKLELIDNHISYNNNKYQNIIFCEGYKMKDNPYFNYLPMNLCKGEVLTLEGNHELNGIYQKNNFTMPISKKQVKVGSNYEWEDLSETPTTKTKEYLLDKMQQYFDFDFEIIEHKAGIRPTVKDRRPLIGKHPQHSNLFVFNGLGTKGVSLAPFLANNFALHLLMKEDLIDEVTIERFKAL